MAPSPLARCISCLLVLVSVLLAPLPASAAIKEAEHSFLNLRLQRAIDRFAKSPLGIPADLKSPQDLYVLMTPGAAFSEVIVLAKSSVPAQHVAETVEGAVVGTPLAGPTVEWERDDDFSGALVRQAHGRFGLWSSESQLPVGTIVTRLRAAGYTPHVVVRLGNYLEASPVSYPREALKNNVWYNASAAGAADTLSTSARLRPEHLLLTALFVGFVPVMGCLGLLVAQVVGRSRAIPIEKRRKLYPKLAVWPTFAAIAVHLPFVLLYYLTSAAPRTLCDLWFGASSVTAMAPFVGLGPGLLVVLLPVTGATERRLFGPDEGATVPTVELEPEERRRQQRAARLALIPVLIGAGLASSRFALPREQSVLSFALLVVGLALCWIGPGVVRRRLLREGPEQETQVHSAPLTERAAALGTQMGVQARDVRIDCSAAGKGNANASLLPGGRLVVTQRLADTLAPEEMDFILAHELAHLRGRHLVYVFALFVASVLLMWMPIWLLSQRHPVFSPLNTMPLTLVGGTSLFFGVRWLRKQQEYQSDRAALFTTRNLPAAERALTLMVRNSALPHIHEADDFSTHPAMSKRLASLRRAAMAAGLVTEADAALG